MYNNGLTTGTTLGSGTLAMTGVPTLQIIGMAMLAMTMCVGGLLLLRAARLRRQDQFS